MGVLSGHPMLGCIRDLPAARAGGCSWPAALRLLASPAFTDSSGAGCWAPHRGKGKNHLRSRGRGRWGNEKGSEKFQLRKEKPVWKIQSLKYQTEGKGYLERTGEHGTGEAWWEKKMEKKDGKKAQGRR